MRVYSERGYIDWVSWKPLYEWEDEWARAWGTTVEPLPNNLHAKIRRHIRRLIHVVLPGKVWKYRVTDPDKLGVLIVMDAEGYYMIENRNIIPIYLDFSMDMVDAIHKATKDLPAFFVASVDIYDALRERGCTNVRYIAQCAPDIYYSDDIPHKFIDVIQIGRRNEVLHEYMLKYCGEHPDVEYVYQSEGASLHYNSTTRGDIGTLPGRNEFTDMMRRAHVSLVSSPRCDGCRDVFGGADLITARFYESAVFYCHMLGRYTENKETEGLNLASVCPCVKSYEEFATRLTEYLEASPEEYDWTMQRKFIHDNLASTRAGQIMNEIGCNSDED